MIKLPKLDNDAQGHAIVRFGDKQLVLPNSKWVHNSSSRAKDKSGSTVVWRYRVYRALVATVTTTPGGQQAHLDDLITAYAAGITEPFETFRAALKQGTSLQYADGLWKDMAGGKVTDAKVNALVIRDKECRALLLADRDGEALALARTKLEAQLGKGDDQLDTDKENADLADKSWKSAW